MVSSGSATDAFFDHSRGRKPVRRPTKPAEPDHISLDSEDDDENDAVGRKTVAAKKRKTRSLGISSSSDSEIDDGPLDPRYSFEAMIKPRSSNSRREDTLPPPLDLGLSNKRPRLEPTTPSSDSRPIIPRKVAPKQPCSYCGKLLDANDFQAHVDAHVNGAVGDLQADWFEDEITAEIEEPAVQQTKTKQPNLQRRAQEHDKLVHDLGIRSLPKKQSATAASAAIVLDDDDDVIEDTELAIAVQKSSRRPVTAHQPAAGPSSRGLAPVFTRNAASSKNTPAPVAGPSKLKPIASTSAPKAGPSKPRARPANVAIEIDDDEDEYDGSYPNNTPPHTGFLDKMTEDHHIDLAGLGEDEPEEWRETIEKQSRAPATTARGGKASGGGKVFNRGMKSFRRGRGAASRGGRSFKRGRGRGR